MSITLKKGTASDIKGKPELLLVSLTEFYENEYNKMALINILEGKNKISLRIIDWFVTNYSKKNNIEYTLKKKKITSPKKTTQKKKNIKNSKKDTNKNSNKNRNLTHINVFLSYKNQLNAYSKKHFDPFCRRNRIEFSLNKGNTIITTVGQLNFFRWSIQNNIFDYIIKNFKDIEEDMNKNTKKKKEIDLFKTSGEKSCETSSKKSGKKSKKQRRKRAPLSIAATRRVNVKKSMITLSFD